ncbi:hypothetical protein E4T48_01541 [Aureobasidium sp. EXF-10727]|nr:hypothetical protein E4T48_01541 [Aureobasidium sp. EXF-10727]
MDNPSGHGLKGDESVAHVDFKPGNSKLGLLRSVVKSSIDLVQFSFACLTRTTFRSTLLPCYGDAQCYQDSRHYPSRADILAALSGTPLLRERTLGDFGGAMISSPRDTEEEHSKKVESTAQSEGYVAPDIERFFRNKPAYHMPKRNAKAGITLAHVPKRITSATNVWNAGLIIADLMTAAQCFKKPKFAVYDARDAWLDDFFSQRNTNPGMQSYSALLKDTVIRCLDYMPRQRPTPTELLVTVNRGVNMYTGVMRTRDCFDTTQYHGQHDLDPNIPFVDDYPVTQEEVMDLSMSDSIPSTSYPPGGLPTPKTPFKKLPRNPHNTQPSITTASGAPYDTPVQGFLVGPNAGQSVQNFFDPAAGYEVLNQPAPQFDFVDQDGLLQAFEDSLPHG